MSKSVTIKLPFGDKRKIPIDTFHAIKRAVPIFADDAKVASYAAAPHEEITPALVHIIRERMRRSGELTARAYSNRGRAA